MRELHVSIIRIDFCEAPSPYMYTTQRSPHPNRVNGRGGSLWNGPNPRQRNSPVEWKHVSLV